MHTPPANTTSRASGLSWHIAVVVIATMLGIVAMALLDGIGVLLTRIFAAMVALSLALRGGLALGAAIACWRNRQPVRGLFWCLAGPVWLLLALLALSIAWPLT